MKASSILGHCGQLLKIVWKSPQPADQITSEYLRERKYIGSKERRAISEICFTTLRLYGSAAQVWKAATPNTPIAAQQEPIPQEYGVLVSALLMLPSLHSTPIPQLLAMASAHAAEESNDALVLTACKNLLMEKSGVDASTAEEVCGQVQTTWQALQQEESNPIASLALKGCVQEWIAERWYKDSGNNYKSTLSLASSLLGSAPLTARVNTRMMRRDEALVMLRAEGIKVQPCTLSPQGIVFEERIQLTQHELYKSGVLEVQDEGSQLVGFALAPQEDWHILDACAGAGGKALHLAVLQNNRGNIHASDAEPRRLREAYFRAQKAQLGSVRAQALRTLPAHQQRALAESFDAVLIDAPCTGMGTVRRMPLVKWRLTPELLERTNRKQKAIIEEYATYLRPGGILLYVTCSLMKEENENIVQDFLEKHPHFQPEALAPSFAHYGITIPALSPKAWHLTLRPDLHRTDGFFMARMRRVE